MRFKKNYRANQFITVCILTIILALISTYWLGTSEQPLIDHHSFRQGQTAISAKYLFEEGSNIFNYHTPVLGKPWAIPFEFPSYQATVKILSSAVGSELTKTGRLINSAATLVSILSCLLMLKEARVKSTYLIIFTALTATSPIYLYWGRTFMIEGFSLGFTCIAALVYTTHRQHEQDNVEKKPISFSFGKHITIFTTALAIGMLTKATTALPLAGFILLDQLLLAVRKRKNISQSSARKKLRPWSSLYFLLPTLVSILITKTWISHTDQLKSFNENASFILSKNLTTWNFGTIEQRLDTSQWMRMLSHMGTPTLKLILPIAVLALALIANYLSARHKPTRTVSKSTYLANFGATMYAAGPLIFFNLYVEHDYYSVANLIFGFVSLSASCNTIIGSINSRKHRRASSLMFSLAAIPICVVQLNWFGKNYAKVSYLHTNEALVSATQVKQNSSEFDRLITIGDDWSSQLFYLAGLRGLALEWADQLEEKHHQKEISRIIEAKTDAIFIISKNEDIHYDRRQTIQAFLAKQDNLKKVHCIQLRDSQTHKAYKCIIKRA